MTTVNKQLIINRLLLPFDMLYEINGFVFHEKEKIDKKYKKKWEKCTNSIKNACIASRIELNDDNDNDHWAFWLGDSSPQMQATNCIVCGEYKLSETIQIPIQLLCMCDSENQDQFDEYDEDDDTYDY